MVLKFLVERTDFTKSQMSTKKQLNIIVPQQSEWLNTELFSAECGASLDSSRVATAKLNVYPYIIPVLSVH